MLCWNICFLRGLVEKGRIDNVLEVHRWTVGVHRAALLPKAKAGRLWIDGHRRREGTKGDALMNREGLPFSVAVGPRNAHDSRQFGEVLKGFRLKKK